VDIEIIAPEPQKAAVKPSKSWYWMLVVVAVVVSLAMVGGVLTWRWGSATGWGSKSNNSLDKSSFVSEDQMAPKLEGQTASPTALLQTDISKKNTDISLKQLRDTWFSRLNENSNEEKVIFGELVTATQSGQLSITTDDGTQQIELTDKTSIFMITEYKVDTNNKIVGISYGNALSAVALTSQQTGTPLSITLKSALPLEDTQLIIADKVFIYPVNNAQ